jgi:phage-related protein
VFLGVQAGVDQALGQVQATEQRVWSALPAPVQAALSAIGNIVSSGINGAVAVIAGLPGRATSAVGNLSGALVSAGRNLVDGFVQGMLGGIQSAAGAAARVARAAVDAAKSALDINSPSRVFRDEVGLMVGLGMAEGIERSAAAVSKSVTDLTTVPSMSTSFGMNEEVLGSGVVGGYAGTAGEQNFYVYETASANATAIAVARRQNGFAV